VITPLVIQGHQFQYQSTSCMRLPMCEASNLHPILHHFSYFQEIADYCSNFRHRQGDAFVWQNPSGWTLKFKIAKFGIEKLQTSFYRMVKAYFEQFRCDSQVWQRDRWTNRQIDRHYRSKCRTSLQCVASNNRKAEIERN